MANNRQQRHGPPYGPLKTEDPLGRLLGPEHTDELVRRANTVSQKLLNHSKNPKEKFSSNDLGAVLGCPEFPDLYTKKFRGQAMRKRLDGIMLVSQIPLMYPPEGGPKVPEAPAPTNRNRSKKDEEEDNKKRRRNQAARDKAFRRDKGQCIITGTSHPHMAHLFSFAATRNQAKIDKLMVYFPYVEFIMGIAWYRRWRKTIMTLGAMEEAGNQVALNSHLHGLLDRAIWSFKLIKNYNTDSTFVNRVQLYWLPALRTQDPVKLSGSDNSVARLVQQLNAAHRDKYPARRPEQGTGFIGAHYQDGERVQSGNLFDITHDNKKDWEMFGAMIDLQWNCMRILTLRGATEPEPPEGSQWTLPGDSDDDKRPQKFTKVGPSSVRGRGDSGRGDSSRGRGAGGTGAGAGRGGSGDGGGGGGGAGRGGRAGGTGAGASK